MALEERGQNPVAGTGDSWAMALPTITEPYTPTIRNKGPRRRKMPYFESIAYLRAIQNIPIFENRNKRSPSTNSLSRYTSWDSIREEAGIGDFWFRWLRDEAASRWVEAGATP